MSENVGELPHNYEHVFSCCWRTFQRVTGFFKTETVGRVCSWESTTALTSTIAFISAVSDFDTYTRLVGQFALYWPLASPACSFKQKKLCLQTKIGITAICDRTLWSWQIGYDRKHVDRAVNEVAKAKLGKKELTFNLTNLRHQAKWHGMTVILTSRFELLVSFNTVLGKMLRGHFINNRF